MLSRFGLVNEYSPLLLTAVTTPYILGAPSSVAMVSHDPNPRTSGRSYSGAFEYARS